MSDLDVAVVGGGIAGLAAGVALLDAGVDSFAILERADAIGGTWRDNVYPGVACDIPAPLYSLTARPNPGWSEQFAPGARFAGRDARGHSRVDNPRIIRLLHMRG